MNTHEDLEAIGEMLKLAVFFDEHITLGEEAQSLLDLTPEVIHSAMYYLKQNPNASIKEACDYGLSEWIR